MITGLPHEPEKGEGPAMVINFLGLADSLVIQLPPDKMTKLMQDMEHWKERKVGTKQELLSLIGSLSLLVKWCKLAKPFHGD